MVMYDCEGANWLRVEKPFPTDQSSWYTLMYMYHAINSRVSTQVTFGRSGEDEILHGNNFNSAVFFVFVSGITKPFLLNN
jgi:hypothetical protein